MLGKSLNEIMSALQSAPRPIEVASGRIPDFNFSADYSTALNWIKSLARDKADSFPIATVLERIFVTVHYEEMGQKELSGYIELRQNGWHIGVNKYEVIGRQRFTLAHELAHLLFHKHIIKGRFEEAIKLFRSEESFVHVEMEANAFAADLLMPSDRFRLLWKRSSLHDISEIFGVSRYAVEYRAKKLRLPEKKE